MALDFSQIFFNSTQLVIVYSLDLRMRYLNPAAEKFFGAPADQLLNKTFAELGVPPDMVERNRIRFDQIRKTKKPIYDIESTSTWKGVYFFRFSCLPIFNDQNEVESIAFVGSDETKKKIAEEHLEAFFNQEMVGVCLVSLEGKYLKGNPKLAKILGTSFEELQRSGFGDFTLPEDLKRDQAALGRMKSGELNFYSREKRYLRKDGKIIWCQFMASTYRGRDGKPEFIVSVVMDVTQQKRMEAEKQWLVLQEKSAQDALKMQARFIASISHEVRTPLHGMVGMLSLLKNTSLNNEQKEYLKAIETSVDSLLNLSNDTLSLMKSSLSSWAIIEQPFNLFEQVELICKFWTPSIEDKGLKFELDLQIDRDQTVVGDALRLRQILGNLLHNAIKFTDRGVIKVRLNCLKDSLVESATSNYRFEVINSCTDFTEEQSSQIQFSLNGAGQNTESGTSSHGMGLSICKSILERFKGEIGFNRLPTQENCIWFKVPFRDGTHLSKNFTTSDEESREFKLQNIEAGYARVLIVEDDGVSGQFLKKWLSKLGFKAGWVASVSEMKSAFKNEVPDWVLLDYRLPDSTGIDASIWIRNQFGSEIKIVGLTASLTPEVRKNCIQAGMNDIFEKPLDQRKLIEILSKPSSRRLQLDPEILIDVLKIFSDALPGRIQKLNQSIVNRSLAELEKEVHAFKSSLLLIGAKEANVCLGRILNRALLEQWEAAMVDFSDFKRGIDLFLKNSTYITIS